MVFVKVREVYDLGTVKNKMTVIAVHTPDPDIIKTNWAGLLMNCKFYRPVSCNVRLACASVLPVDPQGVGLAEGDVAPEDMFNPILYKACTNESFSLLESRILNMNQNVSTLVGPNDVVGDSAAIDVDTVSPYTDDFGIYYGLLSDAHGWRHAMPQQGLTMTGLKPYVHEVLASFGSVGQNNTNPASSPIYAPNGEQTAEVDTLNPFFMRGHAKPMPRMPTTAFPVINTEVLPGFQNTNGNSETTVPYMRTLCGCIIVPPARLHELYFRMVCEWTIEFSEIRTISEIGGWAALNYVGGQTHLQNYDYGSSKVVTSTAGLASANVDIEKVM